MREGFVAAIDRHPRLAIALVVLANLAVKLPTVASDGLWLDEALSIHVAQQPLSLAGLVAHDPTPPLHYLLLTAWGRVFGLSLESARILSVIVSSLTAAALFDLARRHLDGESALVAVALYTASGLQLHYAQEARCYALVGLLVTISFDVFLALLARPSWAKVVALGVVNGAIVHAHYLAVFGLAVQAGAAVTLARHDGRALRRYVVSQLLAAAICAPLLVMLLQLRPEPPRWISPPTPGLVRFILKRFAGSSTLLTLAAILLVAAAALRRRLPAAPAATRRTVAVLALWAVLPIVLAYAASSVRPMLVDRYVLYASLGLYLLLAAAIASLPVAAAVRAGVALLFVALSVHAALTRPVLRNDWRSVVAIAAPERAGGAVLIVAPHWHYRPLAYYLDRAAFRDHALTWRRLQDDGVLFADDVRQLALPARRIVLVLGPDAALGRDGAAAAWLAARRFRVLREERLRGLLLLVAEPAGAPIPSARSP